MLCGTGPVVQLFNIDCSRFYDPNTDTLRGLDLKTAILLASSEEEQSKRAWEATEAAIATLASEVNDKLETKGEGAEAVKGATRELWRNVVEVLGKVNVIFNTNKGTRRSWPVITLTDSGAVVAVEEGTAAFPSVGAGGKD